MMVRQLRVSQLRVSQLRVGQLRVRQLRVRQLRVSRNLINDTGFHLLIRFNLRCQLQRLVAVNELQHLWRLV